MAATAKPGSYTAWLVGVGIFGAAAGLAGVVTLTIVGWAQHGDRIFIDALAAGWATCF